MPRDPGYAAGAAGARHATVLTGIRREALPGILRVSFELEGTVTFEHGRLERPTRVFIDFQNTTALETVSYLALGEEDATPIRIGRQPDARVRVVLDLGSPGRYRVYRLSSPERVVLEIERPIRPGERDTRRASPGSPAATATRGTPSPASAIGGPGRSTTGSSGVTLSRQLGLGISRIVIDPGHGGHDSGARVHGLNESDVVLDVALRLEQLLLARGGMDVVLTRRTDTFLPLEERTALANRVEADLFLSLHANSSSNTSTRGVETYVLNFASNAAAEAIAARENAGSARTMRHLPEIVQAITMNDKLDESRGLAQAIQTALFERLRHYDRSVRDLGVKQAPFVVLIGATMPSVLTEISFLTNRDEAALLATPAYRQSIAEALLAGVLAYQKSLETTPAVAAR